MIINIFISIVFIFLDQLSKFMATKYLINRDSVVIIPHLLGLKYTENTGMAFSMLSGKTTLLIVITAIALLTMAYFIFIKTFGNRFENFCFLMIFCGGVGNLIDRVCRGYVVDYFEFLFIDFAIFNVADVYVCLGVGLYAIYTIYTEFYLKEKKK